MTGIDAILSSTQPHRRLLLVAAAALIDAEGRVLLAERPAGKSMAGLWEFPGGKINPDETPESALSRELHEELGITTEVSDFWPMSFASHAYPDFHLLMPVYGCRVWSGNLHPREGQRLAWVTKLQFKDFPMPPADLTLVQTLSKLL